MPLSQPTLKAALESAFLAQYEGTPTSEQQAQVSQLADSIATAVDAFVKSGTVNTTVTTTGGGGSGIGAVS